MLDGYFKKIVYEFENPNISDEVIVELINKLADSGEILKFKTRVFDFASSGGPSSLSTILVPLYLFAYGESVINLAVPGRPAGAIDVLSQIPNYIMSDIDISELSQKHFYLHLEASQKYAPLDKQLFEYRKKVDKINNPNLAIASLLAKKVASGASDIGLDVRVASFGNFGKNWMECVLNSKRYNRIANILGINSICFLSDADVPYQPYIGRGEALIALYNIINNIGNQSLFNHNNYCMDIAKTMVRKEYTISKDSFRKIFVENLVFQSSNYKNFESKVENILSQPYRLIRALDDGYIYYNLLEIRRYLVYRQSLDEHKTKYPDPSGMILLQEHGTHIVKGQPIIQIRNSIPRIEESHSFFKIEKYKCTHSHEREVI